MEQVPFRFQRQARRLSYGMDTAKVGIHRQRVRADRSANRPRLVISGFEVAVPNCYAPVMSRKSPDSRNGFADVIGVGLLLLIALPLLVALFSFNRYDLSFFRNPPLKPPSNWIGIVGAYLAWF